MAEESGKVYSEGEGYKHRRVKLGDGEPETEKFKRHFCLSSSESVGGK